MPKKTKRAEHQLDFFQGMEFDEFGRELPKRGRIELPVHLLKRESDEERLSRIVRREISLRAHETGAESIEESDDFEVDEDPEDFISDCEFPEMLDEYPVDRPPAYSPAPSSPEQSGEGSNGPEGGPGESPASDSPSQPPSAAPGSPEGSKGDGT